MNDEQQRAEDLRTHKEYNLNAIKPMSFARYEYLRDKWRDLGGKFYGPNIEHGSMPESRLLPFLAAIFLPHALDEPVQTVGHKPVEYSKSQHAVKTETYRLVTPNDGEVK